ncbi:MAG: hypothetical protein ACLT98_04690 [Eggerthellaceae bacterium]
MEKLAQQGCLSSAVPIRCVGINVLIHTVILTAFTKFDGFKMRRLRARDFIR